MGYWPGTICCMTWLSGSCYLPADGTGASYISTDAYLEPVIIQDADVHADNAEVERERVVLDEAYGFPHVERGLLDQ